MTDFLVRRFVRDSEDTESTEVRTRYGILASVVGIFCNVFLLSLIHICAADEEDSVDLGCRRTIKKKKKNK